MLHPELNSYRKVKYVTIIELKVGTYLILKEQETEKFNHELYSRLFQCSAYICCTPSTSKATPTA